jgi:phosphatidylinositol phospholipase C delta
MSLALLAWFVCAVGVKCRGFRKSSHPYFHADENASISGSKFTKSAKKFEYNNSLNNKGESEDEDLYAPEHVFSLSENNANRMLGLYDGFY